MVPTSSFFLCGPQSAGWRVRPAQELQRWKGCLRVVSSNSQNSSGCYVIPQGPWLFWRGKDLRSTGSRVFPTKYEADEIDKLKGFEKMFLLEIKDIVIVRTQAGYALCLMFKEDALCRWS